jgi:hypothetical protein
LLPDLVGRLNDRKPVLRSISAACPFEHPAGDPGLLIRRRASWRATANQYSAWQKMPTVTYWVYEKISPSELRIAEDEPNVQGWKPSTYTKGSESK